MKPNDPFDFAKDFQERFMSKDSPRAPYEGMSIEELIANMKHNIEVLDERIRNR